MESLVPSAPAAAPPPPATPSPRQPIAAPPPSSRPEVSALADKKGGSGAKVGVLVALVVVMAAGAAAWFTHLIPHP
jgi:hypothetical protein